MHPSSDGMAHVFVFPATITFHLEDQTTHKQVLTLHNPYDIPIKFVVLCTNSRKYQVTDAEGPLKPGFCIDIVIRHVAVSLANCQATDKFRIQMYDFVSKRLLGIKDVTATLLSGKPERSIPDKDFQNLPPLPNSSQQQYSMDRKSSPPSSSGPNQVLLISVAMCCIAALFLPTEGQESSSAISWSVSVNLKLVFAYVLGLVTMAILHPN